MGSLLLPCSLLLVILVAPLFKNLGITQIFIIQNVTVTCSIPNSNLQDPLIFRPPGSYGKYLKVKNEKKRLFFVGILKTTEEKIKSRIRIQNLVVRISSYGSYENITNPEYWLQVQKPDPRNRYLRYCSFQRYHRYSRTLRLVHKSLV